MQITPVDICRPPSDFDVSKSHYDSATQRRIGLDTSVATTFRATQTHSGSGKPNDNDNEAGCTQCAPSRYTAMPDLLIITNSYDVTTDLLLDRMKGQPIFRLNFDQLSQHRMLIDKGGFSIADPIGRCVTSQTVAKVYWRKPFNALAEEPYARAKFVDAELRYALTELVNLLWAAEKFVLVEPFAEKRTGKLVQLQCARSFFEVAEYEFILNRIFTIRWGGKVTLKRAWRRGSPLYNASRNGLS